MLNIKALTLIFFGLQRKTWYNLLDFEATMKPIYINSEFVTLGQALKIIHLISSGGEAKRFLAQHKVIVDGELETRRGRKLYPKMTFVVDGKDTFEVTREA